MIGEAFAADLLRAMALADGVDQLNAIRVDDPEHRWGGQERPRPVLMGREETKEPGALGRSRKQGPIIARQPPIEGPVAPAFEGVEQPQGDHLTGPEVRLGMFGDGAQPLIDLVEQRHDKLDGGGHRLLRSWQGCTLSTSLRKCMAMTRRPTSTIGFIGLQATNTIGYVGSPVMESPFFILY